LKSIIKPIQVLSLLGIVLCLNACVATKIVTVPMRVGGAVVSVVPVVGDVVDEGIDTAADAVDLIPL